MTEVRLQRGASNALLAAWVDRILDGGELWTHHQALVDLMGQLADVPPSRLGNAVTRRRRAAFARVYRDVPLRRALRGAPWWVRLDIAQALTGRTDRDVAEASGVTVRKIGWYRTRAPAPCSVIDAAALARVWGLTVDELWAA